MKRTFALNTEPHVAEIGDKELEFIPEVIGDEFLDAYTALQDTYKNAGIDLSDLSGVDTEKLREVTKSLRAFLANFMLPASATTFQAMRLPDRILVELTEFVVELYSGGSRPPTSSPGSATPSRKAGNRGPVTSRSRALTPTPGT